MEPIICSILLPTRKRFPRLIKCIESIIGCAGWNRGYEIIVRIHRDDPGTLCQIHKLLTFEPVRIVIGNPMCGYECVYRFYEEAAALANGHWVWLMTDDAIVLGENWVRALQGMGDGDFYISPGVHRLGGSTYPRDLCTPFPVVLNKSWGDHFEQKIDHALYQKLVIDKKWPVRFLEGVTVWHQQDPQEVLDAYHKT